MPVVFVPHGEDHHGMSSIPGEQHTRRHLIQSELGEKRVVWKSAISKSGWWLSPTPLKNDEVRQLWWWKSQYMEKNMFQTTNQKSIG